MVTDAESGLPDTYRALFANRQVASKVADLDELIGQVNLKPWITFTVALNLAHERDNGNLWNSFEGHPTNGYIRPRPATGTGTPGMFSRTPIKVFQLVMYIVFQSASPQARLVVDGWPWTMVPRCLPEESKIQTPPEPPQ